MKKQKKKTKVKEIKGKIKKTLTFAELMDRSPKAAEKLAELGLFCGGCPMAQLETIENGALAHGLDPDELVKELNK